MRQLIAVVFIGLFSAGGFAQTSTKKSVEKATGKTVEKAEPAQPEAPQTESSQEETPLEKAEETLEKAGQAVEQKAEEVAAEAARTRDRRGQGTWFGIGTFSPADLLIPGKLGATVGFVRDADQTWELEYVRGSLTVPFVIDDIGGMTDTRISVIGRSYFGRNSFNISYGLSHYDFSIRLGSEMMNRVTAGTAPSLDLIGVQAWGVNVGLGNRWMIGKYVVFGIDWFSWSQPVGILREESEFLNYVSNQDDRDKVEKGISVITKFPRFVFFKVQLGAQF